MPTKKKAAPNPTGALTDQLGKYLTAKGTDLADKLGGKIASVTTKLEDAADNGGLLGPAASTAAKKLASGASPAKAALSAAGTELKEKVKSALGKGKGGGGKQKSTCVVEDIDIGAAVSVVYDQWTQFAEFPTFTKGVENVDQEDEVHSTWHLKVAKSRRTTKTTITDQVPDRRIAWTSEGPKGFTKGVVTFHPLADDLTKVLLVLEYHPRGLVEKTGNIWRAAGRRARLDLKHFRRFISMRNEATGSWRGTIADGEVVAGPDEEPPESEVDEPDEDAEDTETDEEEVEEEPDEEEPAAKSRPRRRSRANA